MKPLYLYLNHNDSEVILCENKLKGPRPIIIFPKYGNDVIQMIRASLCDHQSLYIVNTCSDDEKDKITKSLRGLKKGLINFVDSNLFIDRALKNKVSNKETLYESLPLLTADIYHSITDKKA